MIFDNGELELRGEDPELLAAWAFPPLEDTHDRDGVFGKVPVALPPFVSYEVEVRQIRMAGTSREVPIGRNRVAVAPNDHDFAAAAVWKLRLPDHFEPADSDALLRIRYRGDVARIKIGEKLVMDDFYNGRPLELDLRRFAAMLREADGLTLEILPLPRSAQILLPPEFADAEPQLLHSVEMAPRYVQPLVR